MTLTAVWAIQDATFAHEPALALALDAVDVADNVPEGVEVKDAWIDAVVEEAEIVGKTEDVEENSVEETDVIETGVVVESAVVVKTEVAVEAIVVEGIETVMGLDVAPPPLPPWRIPFLIAWSKRSFAVNEILAELD